MEKLKRAKLAVAISAVVLLLGAFAGNAFAATSYGAESSDNGRRFVPDKPERTVIPEGFSRTSAHIKFRQNTQVRLREGQFVSEGEDDLMGLATLMAAHPEVVPSRLFSARSEEELLEEKRRLERRSGRELGDKNLYFRLEFPETTDAAALIEALNALDIVEIAYPEPLPGPDPTMHTPDFRPQQG
jgi:hypothetical protein